MMLVRCRADVPISLVCLMQFGNSPDHGIIGAASQGDVEGMQPWGAWPIRWHAEREPPIGRLCRQSIFGEGSR